MLGIIIATHGSFSSGLKDAANVITGSADSIETVSLNSGDDVNILCDEIYNKINLVNKGNGVVIFVDLTSASPYNQSMMAIQKLDKELQKSTYIVSGVNLPMVLEAINSQFLECDVNTSIRNIEEQADQSIAVWNISSLQSNEEEDDDFLMLSSNNILTRLKEKKLMPLYTVNNIDYIPYLEDVLIETGINYVEIPLRTSSSLEAIKLLSKNKELLVGAGTVRNLDQAKMAIEAGASFLVSPSVVSDILVYGKNNNIPVIAGAITPTEIQSVVDHGYNLVKFFPAEFYGGYKAIDALRRPFYDVEFMPTGISKENIINYLNTKGVIAVGGSFIISEDFVARDNGKFAKSNLLELIEIIKCKK